MAEGEDKEVETKERLYKEAAVIAYWPPATHVPCCSPRKSIPATYMIQLSTVAKKLHHRIRLNKGFRSDLEWWVLFFTEVEWNQSDVQCHMRTSKCDVHV